jgi:hypothetical protein
MKTQYALPSIIKHESNEYILSFDDLGCVEKTFSKFDVVPDGHAWEKVIITYCDEHDIDTSEIDFDSESDLFSAYSDNRNALNSIVDAIDVLASKPRTLSSILEQIDLDDDSDIWEASDFIDHLRDNNTDLTKPLEVTFDLEFKSLSAAKEAAEVCAKEGYRCFIDDRGDEVLVMAIVCLMPDEQVINNQINYLTDLATRLDGEFVFYNEYSEEFDNPVTNTFGSTWVTYETPNKNT